MLKWYQMFISPWKFAKLQLQQQQSNHKKTKNYRGRRTPIVFPLRFSCREITDQEPIQRSLGCSGCRVPRPHDINGGKCYTFGKKIPWQKGNPQMVIGHTSSNDYNDSCSVAVSSFFRSFQVFHWWSWFMIPKLSEILHSLTLREVMDEQNQHLPLRS